MYARTIKINFKDKMSKDMFVNFTDNQADSEGIKNGTLLKFIFENSDTSATLVLLFPDFQTFKKDHDNLAGPSSNCIFNSCFFKDSIIGPAKLS